jgi:hypothetical protein
MHIGGGNERGQGTKRPPSLLQAEWPQHLFRIRHFYEKERKYIEFEKKA